jgi:hypothetical protein
MNSRPKAKTKFLIQPSQAEEEMRMIWASPPCERRIGDTRMYSDVRTLSKRTWKRIFRGLDRNLYPILSRRKRLRSLRLLRRDTSWKKIYTEVITPNGRTWTVGKEQRDLFRNLETTPRELADWGPGEIKHWPTALQFHE